MAKILTMEAKTVKTKKMTPRRTVRPSPQFRCRLSKLNPHNKFTIKTTSIIVAESNFAK